MKAVNSVSLIGNLGGDATKFDFENGASVVEFSLAVDNSYKDKSGERVQRTNWIPCKLAASKQEAGRNLCDVLKKGSSIAVNGQLIQDSYKKEDSTITTFHIKVGDFSFVGSKA